MWCRLSPLFSEDHGSFDISGIIETGGEYGDLGWTDWVCYVFIMAGLVLWVTMGGVPEDKANVETVSLT